MKARGGRGRDVILDISLEYYIEYWSLDDWSACDNATDSNSTMSCVPTSSACALSYRFAFVRVRVWSLDWLFAIDHTNFIILEGT